MIVKIGQIGVYQSFFISLIYDTIKIEDEKTVICSRTSKNRGWITASSSVRQSIGNKSSLVTLWVRKSHVLRD